MSARSANMLNGAAFREQDREIEQVIDSATAKA
jgi:hypothetical protein